MQSNEEFVKFLGEGAYGYVNLVRCTNPDDGSSSLTAVKNSYDEDYDSLQRELQILLELRGYPRIVTCFGDSLQQGLSSNGNKVHKLRLEYASEGSLNAFMNRYPDRMLPEPLIKDFTRMILLTTQFKRTLNRVLRLKTMPLKQSTHFNCVSVH